ncbi:hypothetical protein [Streptomyces sp. ODS28]|uniref:hypothetical protein n=1 Tax=Streptomyces sp. ODS28 TaxID=3136688 RepID=UPI0031ED3B19
MGRGGWSLLVAAALLVPVAGCGDPGEDREKAPQPTRTEQETPRPTRTASPPAGEPADPKAAEAEVRRNWQRFFDPDVSNDEKAKVLENGEQLKLLLEAFNGDQRGRQVRAKVQHVSFTSAEDADVDYALTLKGATALPGAKGTSVEQGGVWKVSVKSLCALVRMSGTNVPKAPGC